MATPFEQALEEVCQDLASDSAPGLPTWRTLHFLHGFLAHQESKIQAIRRGLLGALLALWEAYSQAQVAGTGVPGAEAELLSDRYPDDWTFACRAELAQMLRSLTALETGRTELFRLLPLSGAFALLRDPNPHVRVELCEFLAALLAFPDAQDVLRAERSALPLLYEVLLSDPDPFVVSAAVGVVDRVTMCAPLVPEAVVAKLLALLATAVQTTHYPPKHTSSHSHSSSSSSSSSPSPSPLVSAPEFAPVLPLALAGLQLSPQTPHRALVRLLSTLARVAVPAAGKELCVRGNAVPLLGALLPTPEAEAQRLAAAALAALAVAPAGKRALVAAPDILASLCALALDRTTFAALRTNAIHALRGCTDVEEGLVAAGAQLLAKPEVLHEVLEADKTVRVVDRFLTLQQQQQQQQQQEQQKQPADEARPQPLCFQALRTLEVVLATKHGCQAAWSMLDIVPRLEAIAAAAAAGISTAPTPSVLSTLGRSGSGSTHSTHSTYSNHGSGSGAGSAGGPVSPEALLASKCLTVLCQELREARVDLERVRQRQRADAARPVREGLVFAHGVLPDGVWP